MVKQFQFSKLPVIIFRNGIIAELASIALKYGNKIILVTGKNSFQNSLQSEELFESLEKSGIVCEVLSVPGEPSPELIDQAVKMYNKYEINLVIGIGGGSVLDCGKAVSAMMYRSESIVDFLEVVGNKEHPGTKLPYIAVPTTSGTGSEATKNAVISQIGENGFKRSLRHDNFVPDIALIDPELTLNCPGYITAASGMDCFTQLTEAYLSDRSNSYTDALAIEGIKAIRSSLLKSYLEGKNIEARSDMSFAALTSGICIANAGLGIVHGFASSIGGMCEIPHGLICGTLMAVSNEINLRELRNKKNSEVALNKYALLGKLFVNKSRKTDEYYQDCFINYLHTLTQELHLKGLRDTGFNEKDIAVVCSRTELKNNPVKLTDENLSEILYRRL
jgi:alcohol dehydrogenase class IV